MVNTNVRLLLILPAAALIALAAAQDSLAFHNGGVGECDGCHTVHNSLQSRSMTINPLLPGTANVSLLLGSDPSSTCLICHQHAGDIGPTTYHVSTPDTEMPPGLPPKQLTPGGDFGWLKKTYGWIPALGQTVSYSFGERHGHNIIAADYGYAQDMTNLTAPGGAYPSASLSCISCHDPHGKYRRNQDGSITVTGTPIKRSGSFATSSDPDINGAVGTYRLLGGTGYSTTAVGRAFAFIYSPPAAVAPLQANKSEDQAVTRVGYGAGMSDWCRNCHTNIHNTVFTGNLTHDSGIALGPTIMNNYNTYLKSGNVSGTEATAYSSLVPFEIGTNNYALMKGIVTNTPTKGPDSADGTPAVMCLSCHRAHASGWDEATRWNSKTEFVVYNGYYAQEGQVYQPYGQGRLEQEALRAYYNTPETNFAPMQKSLCNKCHVNDLN